MKETKYLPASIVTIITLVVLVLLWICRYPQDNRVSNSILLITAAIILYYTYETYRLRLEAQKQTKEAKQQSISSIRPYLRLQWSYDDGLVIVNEGNGVAVNLMSSSNDLNRDVRLNKISAVGAKSSTTGLPTNFKAQADWLDPNKVQYTIHIQFQNADNKRYYAKFKTNTTYNDGFEILEQGPM